MASIRPDVFWVKNTDQLKQFCNIRTSLEDTPSSRNIIQPNNPINGRLGSNIMQTNGTQIATTSFGVRKVSDNNSNINN